VARSLPGVAPLLYVVNYADVRNARCPARAERDVPRRVKTTE